jgi:hypothetical protein
MAAFLFTKMSLTLTGADDLTELHLTLPARTTLVEVTLTTSVSLRGMLAAGGNVDGLVVCFSNLSAFSLGFNHDDGGASVPTNRFRNALLTGATASQFGSMWYCYSSSFSRWQTIGHI